MEAITTDMDNVKWVVSPMMATMLNSTKATPAKDVELFLTELTNWINATRVIKRSPIDLSLTSGVAVKKCRLSVT